jgi:hypothetical protein
MNLKQIITGAQERFEKKFVERPEEEGFMWLDKPNKVKSFLATEITRAVEKAFEETEVEEMQRCHGWDRCACGMLVNDPDGCEGFNSALARQKELRERFLKE